MGEIIFIKEENNRVWRDGSEVKNTDCSSRGPEFKSQKPHGGLQPSVMGSDALFCHADIQADRGLIHKQNLKRFTQLIMLCACL